MAAFTATASVNGPLSYGGLRLAEVAAAGASSTALALARKIGEPLALVSTSTWDTGRDGGIACSAHLLLS